ncbi:hypothetical protein CK203_097176 [Vitis vinifera]|uniref:Uncharacterized protein n=1 Tax=Vitis vinifera TaxID=29760 RepID=A0A438EUP0_VITVI|nr:hypothetical protein CK203_097176 [Vitis vinifera]
MSTRCSTARFKKISNHLLDEKLQAIKDLHFGGLLALNCIEVRHNICLFLIQHFNVGFRRIEFSPHKHYAVTITNVGLIFSLPSKGHIVQVTSTSSEHQFGTIRALPSTLAWTDELIKQRLTAEIRAFGSLGYVKVSEISPTAETNVELETYVDHETNVEPENSDVS